MWNGCADHDPGADILTARIAKERLRALCATAARGGDPSEIRDRLHRVYQWCADAEAEVTTLTETIETWWPAVEVFLTTAITNARTKAPTG